MVTPQERAHAAISRAEASLAVPRTEGTPWEGPSKAVQPRQSQQRPTALHVSHNELRAIVSGIAKTTGAVIRERDARIDELEARISDLEDALTRPGR